MFFFNSLFLNSLENNLKEFLVFLQNLIFLKFFKITFQNRLNLKETGLNNDSYFHIFCLIFNPF